MEHPKTPSKLSDSMQSCWDAPTGREVTQVSAKPFALVNLFSLFLLICLYMLRSDDDSEGKYHVWSGDELVVTCAKLVHAIGFAPDGFLLAGVWGWRGP